MSPHEQRDPSNDATEVHTLDGPLLLLAGPGTGKTYQLARRVKYLVDEKRVDPNRIALITFTAAAAANMRARISEPQKVELFVGRDRQPSTICTMHSLGYRIVRENRESLQLPEDIGVVQNDSTRLVLLEDAAQLAGHARAYSKQTLTCRQFGSCKPDDSPKCTICSKYREILRACGAIDYDDQILLACDVLARSPELAAKYRERWTHLLVDEYQDINAAQFRLIRTLTEGQREGLFVVGDDDQSIYSWRGGSPKFIRGFEKHFGNRAKVIPLVRSRRCRKNILEAALAVVRKYDPNRRDKGVYQYSDDDGPMVWIHDVPSDKREAAIVRRIVEDALPSKDVLILVQNRGYVPIIADQLRRARIAFVSPEPLPGEGLAILERLGVWLRDEQDSLALRECLDAILAGKRSPVPSWRSKTDDKQAQREESLAHVSGLWKAVIQGGQSLWASLCQPSRTDSTLRFAYAKCAALRKARDTSPKDVAQFAALACGDLEPWSSIDDFIREIDGWMSRFVVSRGAVADPSVRVMTFQGAKGLEADVVCVIGLEEHVFPEDGLGADDLAEKSRLMFVSMTRAKYDLHLFHARTRSARVTFRAIHREGGPHKLQASRFLNAIPTAFAQKKYHPAKN